MKLWVSHSHYVVQEKMRPCCTALKKKHTAGLALKLRFWWFVIFFGFPFSVCICFWLTMKLRFQKVSRHQTLWPFLWDQFLKIETLKQPRSQAFWIILRLSCDLQHWAWYLKYPCKVKPKLSLKYYLLGSRQLKKSVHFG